MEGDERRVDSRSNFSSLRFCLNRCRSRMGRVEVERIFAIARPRDEESAGESFETLRSNRPTTADNATFASLQRQKTKMFSSSQKFVLTVEISQVEIGQENDVLQLELGQRLELDLVQSRGDYRRTQVEERAKISTRENRCERIFFFFSVVVTADRFAFVRVLDEDFPDECVVRRATSTGRFCSPRRERSMRKRRLRLTW